MGVSAAITFAAVSTFVASNQAAHAATAAKTAADEQNAIAQGAIATAKAQKTDSLNAAANATQAAQARVRAISNPEGTSIMTSPLGGGSSAPPPGASVPPPAPGTILQGKTVLGG